MVREASVIKIQQKRTGRRDRTLQAMHCVLIFINHM